MQKYFSIFLIINILASTLPSSCVVAIFKIGNLISHFQEHKNESSNYNFREFLEEHYSENQHKEADHEKHKDLPFHHHHQNNCCHLAFQLPVLLPKNEVMCFVFTTHEIVTQKIIAQSPQCNASHYSGDIWQPPKV
jgi:hypothetical protein